MPTYTQIMQEMLREAPVLGSTESIASGSATTCVVSRLATGSVSANSYRNWWMLRTGPAGAADRERICSTFADTTGTLTHAGANYSDTTFTSETLILLRPPFQPHLVDAAIRETITSIPRIDITEMATVQGQRLYWLSDLDWIKQESDVLRVELWPTNVLSRNRYLSKWSVADAAAADSFTLAGAAGTIARSTTTGGESPYSAAVTRAGTDVTLTQTVGLLDARGTDDSLRGEKVTVVAYARAGAASSLRLFVSDGITTTNSSYHAGSGAFAELSKEVTLAAAATALTFGAELKTNETVYIDELYLVFGELTDGVRRSAGVNKSVVVPREYLDGAGPKALLLPERGFGAQYAIYSYRPFAEITTDAQSTDCDLKLAATGALARVFQTAAIDTGPMAVFGKEEKARLAETYRRQFEELRYNYIRRLESTRAGLDFPPMISTAHVKRV